MADMHWALNDPEFQMVMIAHGRRLRRAAAGLTIERDPASEEAGDAG